MKITIQRIYDDKSMKGHRVLVDRLWPRGISKQQAKLDGWWKELAPSTPLRKWFNHEESKWAEFRNRYLHELEAHHHEAQDLLEDARGEPALILLYGAKDEHHNHAVVLKEYLEQVSQNASAKGYASSPCYAPSSRTP